MPNRTQVERALPAANLVGLVATVAVLWWRVGVVQDEVKGLGVAVAALTVEVAVLRQAHTKP